MKRATAPAKSGNPAALLLLGPTASGKTPLGEMLAVRGLRGNRCAHFDFGEQLRETVAQDEVRHSGKPHPDAAPADPLSREDVALLREVLRSGALLEDEHFPIARRILQAFLAAHHADPSAWIVLNGLPRHVGQARAIDELLDVRRVVHLECSPETVWQRIQTNSGGDRAQRSDDELAQVRNRLRIYQHRTAPLLEHYRRRPPRGPQGQAVAIQTIVVTAAMTAEPMWQMLQKG